MTPRMKLWVAASRGAISVCCSGRLAHPSVFVDVVPRTDLVIAILSRSPAARSRLLTTEQEQAPRLDMGSHALRKNGPLRFLSVRSSSSEPFFHTKLYSA